MPRAALTGTRIRALRTARRLAQADLARMAGVSPSYLNLIEHNRRRAGPTLLAGIARALDVPPESLAEGAATPMLAALEAAASARRLPVDAAGTGGEAGKAGESPPDLTPGGPAPALPPPERDRIEEFAGRFPGWAGLIAELHGRVQAQERAITRLSDRMAHDPNLAAALTEIVSAVTAVQSTAAILAETEDLEPEWRRRFHGNIHADSRRLAQAAEALSVWLDASGEETGLAAPLEELESWLARRGFHLPELEPGGAALADPLALLDGAPDLASEAGIALARGWLLRLAQDAQALPMVSLVPALGEQLAQGQGLDPAVLADRLGVGPALVLRRLAMLPPRADLPRFGLVLCDGSGTLTFRRPLDGFALPRFGGACPVWPLYEALQAPGRPLRVLVETTGRLSHRFVTFALAEPSSRARFVPPMGWEAAMLIVPATPAVMPDTASGAGAQAPGAAPRPVGAGCRVCPLADCVARREPSLLRG